MKGHLLFSRRWNWKNGLIIFLFLFISEVPLWSLIHANNKKTSPQEVEWVPIKMLALKISFFMRVDVYVYIRFFVFVFFLWFLGSMFILKICKSSTYSVFYREFNWNLWLYHFKRSDNLYYIFSFLRAACWWCYSNCIVKDSQRDKVYFYCNISIQAALLL